MKTEKSQPEVKTDVEKTASSVNVKLQQSAKLEALTYLDREVLTKQQYLFG